VCLCVGGDVRACVFSTETMNLTIAKPKRTLLPFRTHVPEWVRACAML
jgi:hypothetical protein